MQHDRFIWFMVIAGSVLMLVFMGRKLCYRSRVPVLQQGVEPLDLEIVRLSRFPAVHDGVVKRERQGEYIRQYDDEFEKPGEKRNLASFYCRGGDA